MKFSNRKLQQDLTFVLQTEFDKPLAAYLDGIIISESFTIIFTTGIPDIAEKCSEFCDTVLSFNYTRHLWNKKKNSRELFRDLICSSSFLSINFSPFFVFLSYDILSAGPTPDILRHSSI